MRKLDLDLLFRIPHDVISDSRHWHRTQHLLRSQPKLRRGPRTSTISTLSCRSWVRMGSRRTAVLIPLP